MRLAKTQRPVVRGSVTRRRLHRRLDRAGRRPVTWITGPPGSGKTTLVADYLAARKYACLWYQADEGDADIATTFHYLGLAAPRRRRPLPHLTQDYRQKLSSFTRRFFRELYGRLRTPFALVFDNYQDVPADAQFHDVIREAVEELPPEGRIIVISRGNPPAAFARLHVGRLIESLESSELRFTAEEAGRLVRTLAPGRWPRETLRDVYGASDGWAAGLVLLVDRLRSEGRLWSGAPRESFQVLFDYFASHTFKDLDPDTQHILLQTAVLPSVTASMAEALSGRPAAGHVLADLHRRSYFTTKQAGPEPAFRYHPLFRAFLASQAQIRYSRDRLAEIRRAAASLAEGAGQLEVAGGLLREAEDSAGLAGLICRHAQTLLAQGRRQVLDSWLGSLPPAMFDENPWLFYWRGMSRFSWQNSGCQDDLERAFAVFRTRNDGPGLWASWSGLVISYEAGANLAPTDHWIAMFDDLLREAPFPSRDFETVATAAMFAWVTARQPGHRDGWKWAERAVELTRRGPDRSLWAITAHNWVLFCLQMGDLEQARRVLADMKEIVRTKEVSPTDAVYAGMSVVQWEVALALPSYRETVSSLLELSRSRGIFNTAIYAFVGVGLMGALSDGDVDTAAAWVRELDDDVPGSAQSLGTGYEGWKHSALARIALLRGDLDAASIHRTEIVRLAVAAGCPLFVATGLLVSAEVLRARGEAREACAQVEQAVEIARTLRSPFVEFMARLMEAALCFDRGRESEGLEALRAGMALGRSHGFVNSMVWHPPTMTRLCARALEAGIEVDYVQKLVRVRRIAIESPPIGSETWPWPVKVRTLGRFEVVSDGRPLQFSRKVQRRPLDLLKTVIAHGGRQVREQTLMDALWPDSDGDKARFALTTAVHRLRQLLGYQEAVVRKDGAISLDSHTCWVDIWAVEPLIERVEAAIAKSRTDPHAWNDAIAQADKASELFRGPFLGGDEEISPSPRVDRLRRRLIGQLLDIGAHCQRNGQPEQVVRCYEHALRIDPGAEEVCRRLMKAYHDLGRQADAQGVYHACRGALAVHSGRTPSAETEALARRLR